VVCVHRIVILAQNAASPFLPTGTCSRFQGIACGGDPERAGSHPLALAYGKLIGRAFDYKKRRLAASAPWFATRSRVRGPVRNAFEMAGVLVMWLSRIMVNSVLPNGKRTCSF
jgi:hypothetical protein